MVTLSIEFWRWHLASARVFDVEERILNNTAHDLFYTLKSILPTSARQKAVTSMMRWQALAHGGGNTRLSLSLLCSLSSFDEVARWAPFCLMKRKLNGKFRYHYFNCEKFRIQLRMWIDVKKISVFIRNWFFTLTRSKRLQFFRNLAFEVLKIKKPYYIVVLFMLIS